MSKSSTRVQELCAAISSVNTIQELRALATEAGIERATILSKGALCRALASQMEITLREINEEQMPILDGFEDVISTEPLYDPFIASDGFSYNRNSLQQLFASDTRRSPYTRQRLDPKVHIPNMNLKKAVLDWLVKVGAELPPNTSSQWEEVKTSQPATGTEPRSRVSRRLRRDETDWHVNAPARGWTHRHQQFDLLFPGALSPIDDAAPAAPDSIKSIIRALTTHGIPVFRNREQLDRFNRNSLITPQQRRQYVGGGEYATALPMFLYHSDPFTLSIEDARYVSTVAISADDPTRVTLMTSTTTLVNVEAMEALRDLMAEMIMQGGPMWLTTVEKQNEFLQLLQFDADLYSQALLQPEVRLRTSGA